jgi:hypothetical protein
MKTTATLILTALAVAAPLSGCATREGSSATAASVAPAHARLALAPTALDHGVPTFICPMTRRAR